MCIPAAISPLGSLFGGKKAPLAMLSPAAALLTSRKKKQAQQQTSNMGGGA